MSESVLKKEFAARDVQRLRNLITNKLGDKTIIGTGYTTQVEEHSEGDTWEENGRFWTIKNGLKQNITKLDKAKESILLPLFCPCCSNLMNNKLDKLFYLQYNRCLNCQVDFETKLKIEGKWEAYEIENFNSNIDKTIADYEIWIEEEINKSNNTYFTEQGDSENWIGSVKSTLLKQKDEAIKYLLSLKK